MAVILAICTMIFVIFITFDLMPLFHQKKWKVIWVYCIMMAASYITQFLFELNVDVPSPANPIKKLVTLIFGIKD